MKITTRLYINLIVSSILISVLVYVIFSTSNIIARANKNQAMARRVEQATAELNLLTFEYTKYHETRMEKQWHERYDSLGKILGDLQTSKDEKNLINLIHAQYVKLNGLFSSVVAVYEKKQNQIQTGAPQQELAVTDARENRIAAQLIMINQSMESNAGIFLENEMTAEIKADDLAKNVTLSIIFVLFLTSAVITFIVRRSFTGPIFNLLEGTKKVGKGNLDYKIKVNTKDEIGELAHAFNQMTKNLKNVIASKTVFEKEIIQRKRVENALRESEERWSTILSSIGDAVIATDTKGKITFMNKVAEELTGWNLAQAATQPLYKVFKIINEQTRRTVPNPVEKVLSEGMIIGLANHTILIKKNGAEIPIDDSAAPIKDSKGKPVGVVLVSRDIMERRKTEEILRKNEERFRTLSNLAIEGIVIHDKGIIIEANDALAKMFGFAKGSEMVGMSGSKLMTQETRKLFLEHIRTDSREPYQGKGIKKDGRLFPIEIHGRSMDYKGEKVRVGTVSDLTERKRIEEALREIDRKKDEFISIASHELKTPITVIKAFTEIMQRRFEKAKDTQSEYFARNINDQVDRLTNLVNDLLDVSKIKAGKLKFNYKLFDLDDLVKKAVVDFQQITQTHQIEKNGEVKIKIYGDGERIYQVMINLISNAIKYSPAADRVIINCLLESDRVEIVVRDFGLGIPESKREKIFERFYRDEEGLKKDIPGTGMGLYISREIIQRHGGELWCESEKGKGSTFSFTLPIRKKLKVEN